MVAQRQLLACTFGQQPFASLAGKSRAPQLGGGQVVQRVGFGADTTYGLEVEFINRWLTPLPKGKAVPRLQLGEGEAFREPFASPQMTITGDDGRDETTVLEIESRVYTRDDFAADRVRSAVDAFLAHAPRIIASYRARQPALLAEERRKAGKVLGRPVSDDVLANAGSLAEQISTVARSEHLVPHYRAARDAAEQAMDDRLDDAVVEQRIAELEPEVGALELALFGESSADMKIFERCNVLDARLAEHVDLHGALQAIASRQAEAPAATLQVTTLAKKGPSHAQALVETSAEVSALNRNLSGAGADLANRLHGNAEHEVRSLLERFAPKLPHEAAGGAQLLEDFRVTLECAVKMVVFSEADALAGSGTVKNLPHVLPRRIIQPPPAGFAAALSIDESTYNIAMEALSRRLAESGSANDSTAQDILLMLRRGSGEAANKAYEAREAQWEAGALRTAGRLDPRFSLWTVEGGVPTLEEALIRGAGKPDSENWVAHELRNFGWAMPLTATELQPYLELLKRRAVG